MFQSHPIQGAKRTDGHLTNKRYSNQTSLSMKTEATATTSSPGAFLHHHGHSYSQIQQGRGNQLPSIGAGTLQKGSGHMSTCSTYVETQSEDSPYKGGRRVRILPELTQGPQRQQRIANLSQQWVDSYRKEQSAAQAVVDVARELFYDVMVRCHSIIVEDGYEQMQLLAVKAAVSCFLLEEIVKALPRHVILSPFVGLLLRTLYVPDTQEMRDTLGGSLEYPFLLKNLPIDSATRKLLARYARKTYFIAHHELTQKVIIYAHNNRSRMQHFRRLPRVFALLNTNWIKSILRTVLKAWRHMCRMRRQGEQKYRARWARRFAAERVRTVVWTWRAYANIRLKNAAAEEQIKNSIETLKANTKKLEDEIETFLLESVKFSAELEEKEKHRAALEKRIAETEQEYKRILEKVREMDRVGSRLLDSLLIKTAFPEGAETLSPLDVLVLWANTTLLGSPFGALLIGLADEEFAKHIDAIDEKNGVCQQQWEGIKVSDVSEEDLPFSRLLVGAGTATVYIPMHYFLALICAMSCETCPSKEDLKTVCLADIRVRSLRSRMEGNELLNTSDPEMAAVLEAETTVGRILIEAYQTLTGNTCIVKAEQLMTRKRGIQLVFLAALMRYFANWMETNVRKQRSIYDSRPSQTVVASTSSWLLPVVSGGTTKEKGEEAAGVDSHLGVRDRKYSEWYHPPQSHFEWIARVENQRKWIAASLSGLHESVKIALETQSIVPTEVQEDTPEFMENVTLKRLSDIFPKEAITSGTFFLRLARCVESALPRIRALFLLYAQRESSTKGGDSRYITSLNFWHLLRDCRVVCGPGRLDRSAVRSIFMKVFKDNTPPVRNTGRFGERKNASRTTGRPLKLRMAADVELKSTHYKMRFNVAEYVEILLRCAHMWDAARHRVREGEKAVEIGWLAKNRATSPSKAAVDSEGNDAKPQEEGVGVIQYDAYDMTWALRPDAVQDFFRECIITRGLRGPTLDPFRRAMRHPNVRGQFATHLDALFSLFAGYARPKEAYGAHVVMSDTEASMRRLVLEDSAGPNATMPSISSNSGTINVQQNDVGIVRVLTLQGVQSMAVDFDWCRIRRVTTQTIRNLFNAVIVDTEHEPGAVFFPEWLEMLCALALYHNPDPTKPLYEKIGPFLNEHALKYYKGEY